MDTCLLKDLTCLSSGDLQLRGINLIGDTTCPCQLSSHSNNSFLRNGRTFETTTFLTGFVRKHRHQRTVDNHSSLHRLIGFMEADFMHSSTDTPTGGESLTVCLRVSFSNQETPGSTTTRHGGSGRQTIPKNSEQIIKNYRKVLPNMIKHHPVTVTKKIRN